MIGKTGTGIRTRRRRTERRLARRLETAGVRRAALTLGRRPSRQPEATQLQWHQLAFGEPVARATFRLHREANPVLPPLVFSMKALCERLVDMARVMWHGGQPLFEDGWVSVVSAEILWGSLARHMPPALQELRETLLQALSSACSARTWMTREGCFENLPYMLDICEEIPELAIACFFALHHRSALPRVRDWVVNGEEQDPFPWPFVGLN